MLIDTEKCPELDGNEIIPGANRIAHNVFLRECGHCPWCGAHRPLRKKELKS